MFRVGGFEIRGLGCENSHKMHPCKGIGPLLKRVTWSSTEGRREPHKTLNMAKPLQNAQKSFYNFCQTPKSPMQSLTKALRTLKTQSTPKP